MKRSTLLLALASSIFFACNNEKKENSVTETTEVTETKHTTSDITSPSFKHYIEVKNALVASNSANAKMHAGELEKELAKISGDSSVTESMVHAKAIAQTDDLKQQREHFAFLTSCIIPALKTGALGKDKFFIQHCPMALENKGADWVSESNEIRNPYFGDEMLNCGEVKETVN